MKFNGNTILYSKDEILKYLYKALENIENNEENINILLKDAFVLFHSGIMGDNYDIVFIDERSIEIPYYEPDEYDTEDGVYKINSENSVISLDYLDGEIVKLLRDYNIYVTRSMAHDTVVIFSPEYTKEDIENKINEIQSYTEEEFNEKYHSEQKSNSFIQINLKDYGYDEGDENIGFLFIKPLTKIDTDILIESILENELPFYNIYGNKKGIAHASIPGVGNIKYEWYI